MREGKRKQVEEYLDKNYPVSPYVYGFENAYNKIFREGFMAGVQFAEDSIGYTPEEMAPVFNNLDELIRKEVAAYERMIVTNCDRYEGGKSEEELQRLPFEEYRKACPYFENGVFRNYCTFRTEIAQKQGKRRKVVCQDDCARLKAWFYKHKG